MKRPRALGWLIVVAGVAAGIRSVGASAPCGRYTIPGDGTVFDTKTKLTWQQDVPSGGKDWSTATSYCQTLGLPGSGWRLPSVKELQTIVDESVPEPAPTIDAAAFPSTPVDYHYWTSSPVAFPPSSYAWGVNFYLGDTYSVVVADTLRVRCVR